MKTFDEAPQALRSQGKELASSIRKDGEPRIFIG
jgi:hypothetical protein